MKFSLLWMLQSEKGYYEGDFEMKPIFVTITDIVGSEDFRMTLNVNHIVRYAEHVIKRGEEVQRRLWITLTNGDEIYTKMPLDVFEDCLSKAVESAKETK